MVVIGSVGIGSVGSVDVVCVYMLTCAGKLNMNEMECIAYGKNKKLLRRIYIHHFRLCEVRVGVLRSLLRNHKNLDGARLLVRPSAIMS